jgi:dienelactone hydrolase
LPKASLRVAGLAFLGVLPAAWGWTRPAAPLAVNCAAFVVSGDPHSQSGATWTYHSTDAGVAYALEGILFEPPGAGPFPGVVVSHGKGGTPYAYSAQAARVMVGWGMVAIGTMYTHAPDAQDAGNLPDGPDGASDANVLRANKARELLSCVGTVDMGYLAAHGHSMGAFVTGQLVGRYGGIFRAASHTAGGTSQGPNATTSKAAQGIRTPYQLHHSAADTTVALIQDQNLAQILAANGVPHALYVAEYPGYTHAQIALDPAMLERVRAWYQAYGVLP